MIRDETPFAAAAADPRSGRGADTEGVAAAALAASAALPTFSNDQIADFLVDGWWSRRSFNVANSGMDSKNGVLHYNVSALTAAGQALAEKALALYEAVINVDFVRSTAISPAIVDISFDDAEKGAFTNSTTIGDTILYSTVNIGRDWLASYGTGVNSYAFQTYLHEIGHALGLGHAGDYNGNATYVTNTSASQYGSNTNNYLNDSWQATMMSYFSPEENTTVDASSLFLLSPMAADWIALDTLYPLRAAFAGNTVWGFNTTIKSTVFAQLATYADEMAFTIIDRGGIDTVDFSGFTAAQTIRLAAESLSDIGGRIGNMSIARGTVIENAVGGHANDMIVGNGAANTLRGGDGVDRLFGQEGNDSLLGGTGADELNGVGGNDTLSGGTGNDRLFGNAGNDRLVGDAGADVLSGGAGSDTFVFRAASDSPYGAGDTLVAGGGAATFQGAGAAAGDRFDFTALGDLNWGGTDRGSITLKDVAGVTHCYVNTDADLALELDIGIVDGAVRASAYTQADFLFV